MLNPVHEIVHVSRSGVNTQMELVEHYTMQTEIGTELSMMYDPPVFRNPLRLAACGTPVCAKLDAAIRRGGCRHSLSVNQYGIIEHHVTPNPDPAGDHYIFFLCQVCGVELGSHVSPQTLWVLMTHGHCYRSPVNTL